MEDMITTARGIMAVDYVDCPLFTLDFTIKNGGMSDHRGSN